MSRLRHSSNTDVLHSGSIPNNTFTHIANTMIRQL